MALILVVEDDHDIANLLANGLKGVGHESLLAESGERGLRLVREARPDLVLLDLMLPDCSGHDICRRIKFDPQTRGIPVIFLSAKDDEIDRVVGLELGAEDYVVKPFSIRELMLRVQRALDRRGTTSMERPRGGRGIRIDRLTRRAYFGDLECDLSDIEYRLLIALYDGQRRPLSRSDLMRQIWGVERSVSLRTVDAHVKRLRMRLGRAGACIETVRGSGYRFNAQRLERRADMQGVARPVTQPIARQSYRVECG